MTYRTLRTIGWKPFFQQQVPSDEPVAVIVMAGLRDELIAEPELADADLSLSLGDVEITLGTCPQVA